MSQKLLIIVLVVLVVIFVITLGMSACKGSGEPNPGEAGAVDGLKGLQGNRFLEIGDNATTTCNRVNSVTLNVTVAGCAITLEKRAFFRRSTRVVFRRCLDPPACQSLGTFPVFQVFVNPQEGPTQSDPIAGKTCYGTAIGREGGRITLVGNATVSLRPPGCPG